MWRPHGLAALACLLVPWLNPFAPGPSSAIAPYLVSVACAAVLWSLLAPGAVTRDERAALVAASWALAAAVSGVLGLCQYLGAAEILYPWASAAPEGQAYANLRQRNQFGSLTMIGLAALLWWDGRGLHRRVVPLGVVLVAASCAASTSRTGLLQLALVIALTGLWPNTDRARRLRLCLLAAGAYLAAALLLPRALFALHGIEAPDIWGRLTGGDACTSRAVLWNNVLYLIGQKPWAGWGWGQLDYAHYMTLYPQPRFCDILDNAHNLPLHLAVELGLPLATLVLGAICVLVWRARPWREADTTRQLAWTVLAVIGVHSLLEYPLWYGPFEIATVLAVAMLWPARATASPSAPASAARMVIVLVVLAGTLYAAWDYRRVSQVYLPYEARQPAYRDNTLDKVRGSVLFRDQARFAELTLTELTRGNAEWTFATATDLLKYSPEPRVIEKLIESATLLGKYDVAVEHLARFRAAFPEAHKTWRQRRGIEGASALGRPAR